ncbi:hypothetical protein M405DRAFT_714367, partial [Rhizopogon salebrosus TDB-379]
PCRKIEFHLWSNGQGWGGEPEYRGTYNGSYTWFDAGIEKLHTPIFANNTGYHYTVASSGHYASENVVAKEGVTEHTIVWYFLDSFDNQSAEAAEATKLGWGPATLDGKFVRSMQVGGCITLWARARFPGWENRVQKTKITVYWAV